MFSHRVKSSAPHSSKITRRARPAVEHLEARNLLSIFTPAQIRHAYGFDQVAFGAVAGTGAGQTIAIVDAYDDPRIASDLNTFDATFGLPAANFVKATPQGLPAADADWSMEISLDVEWAHTIAPGAKILLVEAKSSSFSDLMGAVNYARNQPGVAAVSMSWGADEAYLSGSFERYYDGYFTTPSGHTGVTFVASSGDDGGWYGAEWPAISPNVVSVGGASLYLTSQGNYSFERGWSGSTGGISYFESEPAYQRGVQATGYRTNPDVAIVGNPNTGLYVYTTMPQGGYTGWFEVGGTSAGSPMWAALVAIADQGRARLGTTSGTRAALDGSHDTLPALYNRSGDFHDVAGGANSISYATAGYDLVTGLGSPKANLLISDLLKVVSAFPAPTSATTSVNSTSTGTGHGKPHANVIAGNSSPAFTASEAAVATALLSGSSAARTVANSLTVIPAVATTSAVTIVSVNPGLLGVVPAVGPVGDAASSSDGAEADTGGDAPMIDPGMPAKPGTPADTETPRMVEQQTLNLVYDDVGSEGHWTAAFSYADVLPRLELPIESGVMDGSAALAVALGGFWLTLDEKPWRRKRPESAR